MTIVIYTDGGYRSDRGVGWAWIAVDMDVPEIVGQDSGTMRGGSMIIPRGAHYAEVYAVMQALESPFAEGVEIRTDAKTMKVALNEGVRGHLDRNLSPVEIRTAEILQEKKARLVYYPGNSDEWTLRVDQLANVRKMRRYGKRRKYRSKR